MEKTKRKAELRTEAARFIKALSREERAAKSRAACTRLTEVPEVHNAETILLYTPLPDELDIWPALHAFNDAGKRVILPKCHPREHELICIEIGDFKKELIRGSFNILEPKSGSGVGLSELQAVITPARAFDNEANRLGRGAGYYDRFFVKTGLDVFKCGIAFDCQIFPSVPMLSHDVPVDAVVTESTLIRRNDSSA
ncbi:MAG: 5-formyltetrahydrofolate cyclo-ligase [Planctomycetota bacterium]